MPVGTLNVHNNKSENMGIYFVRQLSDGHGHQDAIKHYFLYVHKPRTCWREIMNTDG